MTCTMGGLVGEPVRGIWQLRFLAIGRPVIECCEPWRSDTWSHLVGSKACGSCFGTGKQSVPGAGSGVLETCRTCHGLTTVYVPDRDETGGGVELSPQPRTPEDKDKTFATLLTFATALFLAYQVVVRDFQAAMWVKWTIVLAPAAGVYWFFNKYRRLTYILRIGTIVVIAILVVLIIIGLFQ